MQAIFVAPIQHGSASLQWNERIGKITAACIEKNDYS